MLMLGPSVAAITLIVLAAGLVGYHGYRRAYAPPGDGKVEDEEMMCFMRPAVFATREAAFVACLTSALTILAMVVFYSLNPIA